MATLSSLVNPAASESPAEIIEVIGTLQKKFQHVYARLTQVEETTKLLAESQRKMSDKLDGICNLLMQWDVITEKRSA
jgi:hypothetical protein